MDNWIANEMLVYGQPREARAKAARPVESRAQLLALVRGCRISQAIYVVTQLGIPDLLADGPREIDALARATGSHPPSLRRVLLFLAGAGVLDKIGPHTFALTPLAGAFRPGGPGSPRA